MIVFIFFLLGFVEGSGRKPYKYNLDPLEAERLFASLVIKPRLSDAQWKELLTAKLKSRRGLASGDFTNQNHRVVSGDSLWKISKLSLGSPWYWPKLWANNPDISNPHEIDTGRLLAYYLAEEKSQITVPLIRLVPAGGGKVTSLENDTFLNAEIKNRFRPPVLILTEEDPIFGEIRGSYTHRTIMHVHENVYVEPYEDSDMKEGTRYAVVRKESHLRDGVLLGGRFLGHVAKVAGEIEIVRMDGELAVAEVKDLVGTMKRGDLLVAVPKPFDIVSGGVNPPDDLLAKVLQGEEIDLSMFGQGHLLLLNRGSEEGMQVGQLFRVFRDVDPVTKTTTDVLPDFKGEIRVVAITKLASIGFVVRNEEPILVGDTLVPAQRFANRPLPPRRPVNVLEVD